MSPAEVAGWLGTVITLGGYAASVRTGRPVVFHVANTVGVFGIAASAIAARAWPNLALTLAFGGIGLWGLLSVLRTRGEQTDDSTS